jgi:fatty acid desaturase
MSAGIPGLGLGGIFFVLSALLAPVFELPRTLRGRSSRARWAAIAAHLALSLAMIAAVALLLRLGSIAAGVPAITVGVLAAVLGVAKLADLAMRAAPRARAARARIRARSMDPAEERA